MKNSTFRAELLCSVDCMEQMVLDMRVKDEISPTLRTIVSLFDESNRRPTDVQHHDKNSAEDLDASSFNNESGFDREEYVNSTTWSDDHDDQTVVADVGYNDDDPSFPNYPQVFVVFNHRNSCDCLEWAFKNIV